MRDAVAIDKIELDSSSYDVPILPSFKIEGGEYVLLNDILCIFNLREDYALGLITQSYKVDIEVMIDDVLRYQALPLMYIPSDYHLCHCLVLGILMAKLDSHVCLDWVHI